jgi:AraC-like DNA-binding protein
MNSIITEITPLSAKDCFYLVDRYKDRFDYPLHRHDEFELNFIENCKGARRIVGDSIEELGNYDLALIGGGLEHVWEQANWAGSRAREITIQFAPGLLSDSLLEKSQMKSLSDMLDRCKSGVAFEMPSIMNVYHQIVSLTQIQSGFYRMLKLLEILYELSLDTHCHSLASSSFANVEVTSDSRRVTKVEDYINKNYNKDIRLQTLSDLICMTPTAFSRFFKLRTGRTVSDYIIDMRLGHASRLLVDSTMSIVEVCYECGFNNVSNFNRIFKRKKGCSPKVFRENYRRNKVIV